MPKVQEQGNSIPSSLHYALTDSQCNKCGAQLEWNAEFNDINSPKYTARHCGQDYLPTIDSVKVELVKQSITEQGTKKYKEEHRPSFPSSDSTDCFLIKPIAIDDLVKKVDEMINKNECTTSDV